MKLHLLGPLCENLVKHPGIHFKNRLISLHVCFNHKNPEMVIEKRYQNECYFKRHGPNLKGLNGNKRSREFLSAVSGKSQLSQNLVCI